MRTPSGTTTVEAHGRYYGFALPVAAAVPYASYQSVTVTSLDAEGSEIATHRIQPLPPQFVDENG